MSGCRVVQLTQPSIQHSVALPSRCVFSSWHLPKVLIRKSAIRACSGASTLKDQNLGQVPETEKKRREGARLRNRQPSLSELLERCKRAKKIGDNPNQRHRTNLSVGTERVKRHRYKVQSTRYKYGYGNLDLMNMFDVAWHPPKY